jgi:hypothetical protein
VDPCDAGPVTASAVFRLQVPQDGGLPGSSSLPLDCVSFAADQRISSMGRAHRLSLFFSA